MYYLKEQGFEKLSENRLFNWNSMVEYTCEAGWAYVDHGDHFKLESYDPSN